MEVGFERARMENLAAIALHDPLGEERGLPSLEQMTKP
jgi:hypothetical protein